MCNFINEAKRRFRVGDTLCGTGARAKVGSTKLTSSNFNNIRFNEQGTLVCGKNTILWNEGKWATVQGTSSVGNIPTDDGTPNCKRAIVMAEFHTRGFRAGTTLRGGCGARASLGSCSLTGSDINSLRFNDKGNLLAGDKLVWSKTKGWAVQGC